jgi:hypothetical protein
VTLTDHLHHLLWLMEPPFTENWKAYCWAKANALATESPATCADLPAALTKAMQSASKESGQEPQSSNQPRKSDVPRTETNLRPDR